MSKPDTIKIVYPVPRTPGASYERASPTSRFVGDALSETPPSGGPGGYGVLEHRAVQAWGACTPGAPLWGIRGGKGQSGHVEPERIEILKQRPPNQFKVSNKIVCRLVGVGPGGSAVIAKRCRHPRAVIEYTIYKDILPHLPFPALNCYGLVEETNLPPSSPPLGGTEGGPEGGTRGTGDTNSEFCWLFLEDAGEEAYHELVEEHRALSARWLGLMHTSAPQIAAPACLPDKGPKHYLKRLLFVRDTIMRDLINLEHPRGQGFQADDLALLEAIVRQCDAQASHWDQVAAFCEEIPETLVHGDFAAKNLRVRSNQIGMALLPFDWGQAGWGVPAIDLIHVDVTAYWSVVRDHWPWLDVQAIQRLAMVGKIFRCLDAFYWELRGFKYEGLKRPLSNLRIYESRFADAVRAASSEFRV